MVLLLLAAFQLLPTRKREEPKKGIGILRYAYLLGWMDHQNVVPKTYAFYKKSVWLVLFAIYTVSVFVPWVPRSWQPPCNNSWALILHDAFIKGEAFGSDVVFTSGPFGFLYFGAIPQTYLLTLLGWLLISAGFVIAVWKALDASLFPDWAKMLCALVVTAVTASVDVPDAQVYAFIAFASVAWITTKPRGIASNCLVGVALALASLVKFSWFVAIVPSVGVMTLFGIIYKRKSDLIGAIYAVACLLFWLASGQSLSSGPTYLRSALEVTGGYAAAMQLNHPWGMTNVWGFILIAVCLEAFLYCRRRGQDLLTSIGVVGTLGFILFISFKAGFVRHDHHEVVALAVLVSISLFVVSGSRGRLMTSLASLILAASLILYGLSTRLHLRNPSFEPRLRQTFQLAGIADFARFVTGGVSPEKCYERDMKQIAGKQRFELPGGTVDLYPWGGIDLMYGRAQG